MLEVFIKNLKILIGYKQLCSRVEELQGLQLCTNIIKVKLEFGLKLNKNRI